jgi:transcription antitermination factor NusG
MSTTKDENQNNLLKPGMRVCILEGPYKEFRGFIREINPNTQQVKVMINFFGKEIPAEFTYSQVVPDHPG